MGEEKPDEELMGKRKSSPRLSAAFRNADILRIADLQQFIHREEKIAKKNFLGPAYEPVQPDTSAATKPPMKIQATCVSMEYEN
jgi:hypothetical protein